VILVHVFIRISKCCHICILPYARTLTFLHLDLHTSFDIYAYLHVWVWCVIYVHVSKIHTNTYRQFVSGSPTRNDYGTDQYDRWREFPWGESPSRNLQVDTPHIPHCNPGGCSNELSLLFSRTHAQSFFILSLASHTITPHTSCEIFCSYRREDSRSANQRIFKSIAYTDFAIYIHESKRFLGIYICMYIYEANICIYTCAMYHLSISLYVYDRCTWLYVSMHLVSVWACGCGRER